MAPTPKVKPSPSRAYKLILNTIEVYMGIFASVPHDSLSPIDWLLSAITTLVYNEESILLPTTN
jgi:hypothetical protein